VDQPWTAEFSFLVQAAKGMSAKSLAMDTSLPMEVADIDPAFEKAFNAGDLDTLLKLYDDQSVLVAEPGKPVQGLENIKQALMGFLALKLPIQLTVRRVYENGDVRLCVADWSMAGQGPDGKDVNSEEHRRRWPGKPRAVTGFM
jgi:ketosteroid isomerase-like protein